jgi:hypothetical protein
MVTSLKEAQMFKSVLALAAVTATVAVPTAFSCPVPMLAQHAKPLHAKVAPAAKVSTHLWYAGLEG